MDDAYAARVLTELLRHPGWSDADVAYATGVHPGAVARLRRELGLDRASKRTRSGIRRRTPGGRLAALEDRLGVLILRVAPRPSAGPHCTRDNRYPHPPPRTRPHPT